MECIATGRQPLAGFDLAAAVVDTVYAAYESAESGTRIMMATKEMD